MSSSEDLKDHTESGSESRGEVAEEQAPMSARDMAPSSGSWLLTPPSNSGFVFGVSAATGVDADAGADAGGTSAPSASATVLPAHAEATDALVPESQRPLLTLLHQAGLVRVQYGALDSVRRALEQVAQCMLNDLQQFCVDRDDSSTTGEAQLAQLLVEFMPGVNVAMLDDKQVTPFNADRLLGASSGPVPPVEPLYLHGLDLAYKPLACQAPIFRFLVEDTKRSDVRCALSTLEVLNRMADRLVCDLAMQSAQRLSALLGASVGPTAVAVSAAAAAAQPVILGARDVMASVTQLMPSQLAEALMCAPLQNDPVPISASAAGVRAARFASIGADAAMVLAHAASMICCSLLRHAAASAASTGDPIRPRHLLEAAHADAPVLVVLQRADLLPIVPARLPPYLPPCYAYECLREAVAKVAEAQAWPAEQPVLSRAQFAVLAGVDGVPASAAAAAVAATDPFFECFSRPPVQSTKTVWSRLPERAHRALQLTAEALIVSRLRRLAESLPSTPYDGGAEYEQVVPADVVTCALTNLCDEQLHRH